MDIGGGIDDRYDAVDRIDEARQQSAAMKDRAVPDIGAFTQNDLAIAGEGMRYTSVLHIAAGLHHDTPHIAPERGVGPDIAVLTDDHIADQGCGGMDIGGGIDDRYDAVDRIDVFHARVDTRRLGVELSHYHAGRGST